MRLALVIALLVGAPAAAMKRAGVVIGANSGWSMDQPLRHAQEDARRVASTLRELGDFAEADIEELADPTTDEVRAAIDRAGRRFADGEGGLLVLYYSGHADEKHLHLRGPPLSLDELYRRVRELPAAVKVGILDACQSGSILTAKGARRAAAFRVKVQEELSVRGVAFLASSGADELSQEARALKGSFFSHHLTSGLRGAADEDGDGRVGLFEAFRYAAARTTLDTASTPAGAQRPAYLMDLKGRGDIYLTRLDGPVGVLEFPPPKKRCYVTDANERRLVAEVFDDARRTSRLAVPAGRYRVKCVGERDYQVASVVTAHGAHVNIALLDFRSVPLSDGVLKGGGSPGPLDGSIDALKKAAFAHLREGQPEEAFKAFDAVLTQDLADSEGYRGKAQALLAMALRAADDGRLDEADKYSSAALRTDGRLADDPQYRDQLATIDQRRAQLRAEEDRRLTQTNLELGHPRDFQWLGFGFSLIDAHGPLSFSVDWVVAGLLQPALHLALWSQGLGASLRVVPRDGSFSPYFGAGVVWSLPALGLYTPADDAVLRLNEVPLLSRSTFDRAGYVEVGLKGTSRHWQGDLGLAVLYSRPLDGSVVWRVLPTLSMRYFL